MNAGTAILSADCTEEQGEHRKGEVGGRGGGSTIGLVVVVGEKEKGHQLSASLQGAAATWRRVHTMGHSPAGVHWEQVQGQLGTCQRGQ